MVAAQENVPSLGVFSHVTTEKAPLYRAILSLFADAKERFRLHLRPQEVQVALDQTCIEEALGNLYKWGNLDRHSDTSDVNNVEDFKKVRFLYQLSPAGAAAEQALRLYQELLSQRGELQVTALGDIQELLAELLAYCQAPSDLDDGKVHRTLTALRTRFDELTRRAQDFLGSLQRSIDLQGVDLQRFLSYKERLLEYLVRFLGELVLQQSRIADLLGQLTDGDRMRIVEAAARRELADALDHTPDDEEASRQRWRARLQGLSAWFLRQPDGPSQAEVLRAGARSAIPALLAALSAIHDRRQSRVDRVADLRTLGRWFAELDRDDDAHQLWRAAFALNPARHLQVNEETLKQWEQRRPSIQTSWLDAPPVHIALRLRQTGRHARPGRPANVIDRSLAKAHLALLAEAEAAQLRAARRRLVSSHPVRLSAIGMLDPAEFRLLLELLGTSLSAGASTRGMVTTTSLDGTLQVTLMPTADGREAAIETSEGILRGPDHFITICDLFPAEAPCP